MKDVKVLGTGLQRFAKPLVKFSFLDLGLFREKNKSKQLIFWAFLLYSRLTSARAGLSCSMQGKRLLSRYFWVRALRGAIQVRLAGVGAGSSSGMGEAFWG